MYLKKTAAFCALLCGLLFAAELPVDGSFSKVKSDNSPGAWVLHNWTGYKPAATLAVRKGVCL